MLVGSRSSSSSSGGGGGDGGSGGSSSSSNNSIKFLALYSFVELSRTFLFLLRTGFLKTMV